MPRKTREMGRHFSAVYQASMRPRPDAAENVDRHVHAPAGAAELQ